MQTDYVPAREFASASEMRANLLAVRSRLMGSRIKKTNDKKPEAEPELREDANSHVKLYHAVKAIECETTSPKAFVRAWCVVNGTTYDEIISKKNRKEMYPLRKAAIRETARRFPDLPSTSIAAIFHRDHVSVLHSMGQLSRSSSERIRDRKRREYNLTESTVSCIKRQFPSVGSYAEMARQYDVAPATIWCIVNGRTWKDVGVDLGSA